MVDVLNKCSIESLIAVLLSSNTYAEGPRADLLQSNKWLE